MMSDKMKAILMAPGILPERQKGPGPAEWAAGLGMPVGPVMARLIASEVSLEVLRLLLDPDSEALRVRGFTPEGVIPFADSEAMDHYAFLAVDDAEASTDVRPVCTVRKDSPVARVVAPDLASFLALVAVAGAEAIERDACDEDYFARRAELLADPDLGAHFRESSDALLALVGAPLPARPTDITRASPDVPLEVDTGPGVLTLPSIRELASQGRDREARRALAALVTLWLDLGDMVNPSNWSALGQLLAEVRPELPEPQRVLLAQRGALPGP